MQDIANLFWTYLPYASILICVFGLIYRYKYDRFSWTAKSSVMLEKKRLVIGSILFHIGILFVLMGHVGGLLVPQEVTEAFGVTDEMYHMGAKLMGGTSGIVALAGILILTWRRLTDIRVREVTSLADVGINIVLIGSIVLGLGATFFGTVDNPSFNYRENISVWFRQIFMLKADGSLMQSVPLMFKLHIVASFLLIALIPFSRLVHAFSLPISYIARPFIVYRKKR